MGVFLKNVLGKINFFENVEREIKVPNLTFISLLSHFWKVSY